MANEIAEDYEDYHIVRSLVQRSATAMTTQNKKLNEKELDSIRIKFDSIVSVLIVLNAPLKSQYMLNVIFEILSGFECIIIIIKGITTITSTILSVSYENPNEN